jgi:hypothetical protein
MMMPPGARPKAISQMPVTSYKRHLFVHRFLRHLALADDLSMQPAVSLECRILCYRALRHTHPPLPLAQRARLYYIIYCFDNACCTKTGQAASKDVYENSRHYGRLISDIIDLLIQPISC